MSNGKEDRGERVEGTEQRDPYMQGRRDAIYELRESGGLTHSQLGLEILFLLPDEFVRFYTDLFHRALSAGDQSVMGGGGKGGLGKAKGAPSMVLGSEVGNQAKGSGKRWKPPKTVIRSTRALETKSWVDRELRDLALNGSKLMRATAENTRATGGSRSGGLGTGGVGSGIGGGKCRGPKCGKFLKATWQYCPSCGTRVS